MTDPPELPQDHDLRPLVASRPTSRGVWLFAGAAAVGGFLLFLALNQRRETIMAPSIGAPRSSQDAAFAPPPDLVIPPADNWLQRAPIVVPMPNEAAQIVAEPVPRRPARRASAVPTPVQPVPVYQAPNYAAPPPQPIYDQGFARPQPNMIDNGNQPDRVRATRFANPATTVPRGTLIGAVLETALDSTRAGFVRALVSRDVVSFDGTRVLIPRGSRLLGEYKADLSPGQKRAHIIWQRLMRPDGVIVNLDSPAADTLGRAGVAGRVNSHFFERFGGAILQSILSVGSQVAANEISNGAVVVALPAVGQAAPVVTPDRIQPTLKVRQGSSVSVFVAKDLDFSTVER